MTGAGSEPVTVTVCSSCLRASCWKGIYLCEAARTAKTVNLSVLELAKLGLESSDYWDGTYERAADERAALAWRINTLKVTP